MCMRHALTIIAIAISIPLALALVMGFHGAVINIGDGYLVAPTDSKSRSTHTEQRMHNIPYLKEMLEQNLTLSYRQQMKFFSVRDNVAAFLGDQPKPKYDHVFGRNETSITAFLKKQTPNHRMYHEYHKREAIYFGYILSERYVFRHIFKNGGHVVEWQTGKGHISSDEVGNRSIAAVVRDPVDHFLSGWAECGERKIFFLETATSTLETNTYNKRLQMWLAMLIQMPHNKCRRHSWPQAHFLLGGDMAPLDLGLIGDLRELPRVLELTGFQYDYAIHKNKGDYASSESELKQNMFPKRIDLISDETMRLICRYVALDYYLFDFEPPKVCREDPTVLPMLGNFYDDVRI